MTLPSATEEDGVMYNVESLVLVNDGQVPVWAWVGFLVALSWPVKEPLPMTVSSLGAEVVPMPMLPKAVRVPPMVTSPDIEAIPTSSNVVSGEEVRIPTLLLVASKYSVLVSTVRLLTTERVLFSAAPPSSVVPPEILRVLASRVSGFNVSGPTPLVLVEGSCIVVGVILWKFVKSPARFERFILVASIRETVLSKRCSRRVRDVPEGPTVTSLIIVVFFVLSLEIEACLKIENWKLEI